jgi:hypothetical protein
MWAGASSIDAIFGAAMQIVDAVFPQFQTLRRKHGIKVKRDFLSVSSNSAATYTPVLATRDAQTIFCGGFSD